MLPKLNSISGTWTRVTADLSGFQGQTVTLWSVGHIDGAVPADNAWTYLDDVVVTNGYISPKTYTVPRGWSSPSCQVGYQGGRGISLIGLLVIVAGSACRLRAVTAGGSWAC
ncbi:hypothetical protein [Arthrobacter sp. 24S4-2]|uniref:hypothetical protein n=1 Tax=Arthrobacter sp. 24S4-2 TaxID=2575374 RepID=UPI001C31136E|nr:hypothetical protein [Arthrobacter sp. 24S4-2]